MAYNYFDKLDSVAQGRYSTKLVLINSDECPYKFPAGVWKNNPSCWPDLQFGDVYSNLIDSPGIFTRASMKSYKSLDAHNYFQSGWVQTVYSYKPATSAYTILKADVRPSQRLNEEPHHPWVALSGDGSVAVAHCNCMAGLAESCSHIAALLFKVEAAVRLGYTTKLCTELPCKWNADFVKKLYINKAKKVKVRHLSSTQQEQQTLLQTLHACNSKPVVLSTFDNFSDKFHWQKTVSSDPIVPQCLRSLYKAEYADFTKIDLSRKCSEINDSYSMNKETIMYIYDVTQKQSSSLTWHEQRIGRITSSVVYSVLHTDFNNPAPSLLKTLCNPSSKSLDHVPAIHWGFLISKETPFIGASADSVASCSCHGNRVIEVKCPFSHKESTLQEYVKDPSSCIVANGREVKTTHKYYYQIQLHMYVHDVNLCDLVIYTSKVTAIFYILRNDVFIKDMITKLKDFHIRHVMTELLTRQLENKIKQVPLRNDKLYCYCRSKDDGKENMIGCDNPQCKTQWYHLKCLKMKRIPKGQWLCKDCKNIPVTSS
ncbi:Hypothetical predicted protein [Mytilus galloprovincialis]|uniref:PHD-type domain-containing protein n=1 Tax=Mytilus galloprovincialis TaxID=29158 RepID=A0A8B6DI13_MYTGA|nr:Hypothetical predicted protein [Mytilus galloprovincialis]